MRQYLLSIEQPDGGPPPPQTLAAIMRDVEAVDRDLEASGSWVFAGGLHPPSSATVVRVRGEEVLLTDGPYAEGREHVGGVVVLRAHDLDEALAWAERYARATTLPVEVRPFAGELPEG